MPARNCRSFLTSPAKNARIRSPYPPKQPAALLSAHSRIRLFQFLMLRRIRLLRPGADFLRLPLVEPFRLSLLTVCQDAACFLLPRLSGGTSAALRSSGSSAPSSRSSSPGSPSSGFFPFRVIPKIHSCEENPSSSYAALQLTACKKPCHSNPDGRLLPDAAAHLIPHRNKKHHCQNEQDQSKQDQQDDSNYF